MTLVTDLSIYTLFVFLTLVICISYSIRKHNKLNTRISDLETVLAEYVLQEDKRLKRKKRKPTKKV